MIITKALKISFDYNKQHDPHNHELVGYVVQRYPNKVVKASVLTRASVDAWYLEVTKKYPEDRHLYLIGTISLIGLVQGLEKIDEKEDDGSTVIDLRAN